MIPLPGRGLEALGEWWRRRARNDRVEVGRRLMLEAPRRDPAGVWRVRGRLRNPTRTRWIPVELLLWPRLDAWTKLSVEPQRGVRVGRRYFANGHRALDALCGELVRDLPGLVRTPTRGCTRRRVRRCNRRDSEPHRRPPTLRACRGPAVPTRC